MQSLASRIFADMSLLGKKEQTSDHAKHFCSTIPGGRVSESAPARPIELCHLNRHPQQVRAGSQYLCSLDSLLEKSKLALPFVAASIMPAIFSDAIWA
jgi:hypothetical protein